MSREELGRKRKAELVKMCEHLNIDSSGRKAELVDRIFAMQVAQEYSEDNTDGAEPILIESSTQPEREVLVTTQEEEPAVIKAEEVESAELVSVEVAEPVELPKNVVVMVLVGTLSFEGGTFEKGESFTVSRERAALFDPKDIKVLG